MKNTLGDLNNHLFAQLERLGDEDLSKENLEKEVQRAESITKIARVIIENSNTALKAVQIKANALDADIVLPKMLEDK
ncbi:MAG: hypothetical protein ACFNJI_03805 [Leptotrichia hongkongensis]|jgi:phage protein